MDAIYGVGPMTSLALVSWLGGANRFSSSRKAVRFVGLDITVRALPTLSAAPADCRGRGQKCCAGCCSRQPRPLHENRRPPTPTQFGASALRRQPGRAVPGPAHRPPRGAYPHRPRRRRVHHHPATLNVHSGHSVTGRDVNVGMVSRYRDGVYEPRLAPARPLSDRVRRPPAPRTAL
jgi:hypothetical protein